MGNKSTKPPTRPRLPRALLALAAAATASAQEARHHHTQRRHPDPEGGVHSGACAQVPSSLLRVLREGLDAKMSLTAAHSWRDVGQAHPAAAGMAASGGLSGHLSARAESHAAIDKYCDPPDGWNLRAALYVDPRDGRLHARTASTRRGPGFGKGQQHKREGTVAVLARAVERLRPNDPLVHQVLSLGPGAEVPMYFTFADKPRTAARPKPKDTHALPMLGMCTSDEHGDIPVPDFTCVRAVCADAAPHGGPHELTNVSAADQRTLTAALAGFTRTRRSCRRG